MTGWINTNFGTPRGLVRLALSYPQHWLGTGALPPADMEAVRRLVFVCRGNISRSAYADGAARARGFSTASFGVSTAQGAPVDPAAAQVAGQTGLDLSAHTATEARRFSPLEGDLLLAMEVRQLETLGQLDHLKDTPRLLLGGFAGTPHLHDPFGLSLPYYARCFARIDRALDQLEALCPGAKSCA